MLGEGSPRAGGGEPSPPGVLVRVASSIGISGVVLDALADPSGSGLVLLRWPDRLADGLLRGGGPVGPGGALAVGRAVGAEDGGPSSLSSPHGLTMTTATVVAVMAAATVVVTSWPR
ncbi:hypothetical protein [Streptomyces sediminimaris]|uniref:hypothetical protein n=1 Tax=Streptomyces sediminimaris TaxID=3383721 RepID=UPI003999F8FA